MTNTAADVPEQTEPLAPVPPPPPEASGFVDWLAGYADGAGDAVDSLQRYRHLRDVKAHLDDALSILKGEVADGFGPGSHEVSAGGAFRVRKGARRWKYPDDELEARQLLRDVLAKAPEGEDPLPLLEKVWPLNARNARWTPVKEIELKPGDYREADGWAMSVELL